MSKILEKHKAHWYQKQFSISVLWGIFLLLVALMLNYAATIYATNHASSAVRDVFLDSLPILNLQIIYVQGAILLWLFIGYLLIREPKRIPFVVKAVAVFIVIRSLFVMLTHLGPIAGQVELNPNDFLQKFAFGNDYFFSGHTGYPFLMALIFWDEKYLRYFFIFATVLFGASMLLGRFHYSIDVFAAVFITYTIFAIARHIFATDYRLFHKGLDQI